MSADSGPSVLHALVDSAFEVNATSSQQPSIGSAHALSQFIGIVDGGGVYEETNIELAVVRHGRDVHRRASHWPHHNVVLNRGAGHECGKPGAAQIRCGEVDVGRLCPRHLGDHRSRQQVGHPREPAKGTII